MHPQYLSTGYALKQPGEKIAIQHHHAHMASCMAEHKLFEDIIGVIYDGTGLGIDGSIWGGEFLLGNRKLFRRVGSLKQVPLQGGDMAVKEPWRCAASYLHFLGYAPENYLDSIDSIEMSIVKQALASGFNCNFSSSMGRLFDCAAALIGINQRITYDAQATIELENIIDPSVNESSYSYCINDNTHTLELDFADIISGLIWDRKCSTPASVISAKFHNTIIKATIQMLQRLRSIYGINTIALSGGVFENVYLLEAVYNKLTDDGFIVYFNQQIPINDSGIAMGQLAIANESIRK